MACKYLLVLFLLLWLFLGHIPEVRALSAVEDSVPDRRDSTSANLSWSVNYNEPNVTILKSPTGNFIFSLLHTIKAISYCAAVVQHAPTNFTIWVANYLDGDTNGSDVSVSLGCFSAFRKPYICCLGDESISESLS